MEPKLPQHDETIVPVRPRAAAASGGAAPAGASRTLRLLLASAGAVAFVVAAAAAFYWLPARLEQQRAAALPVEQAPAVEAPARPALSPEESAALRAQSGDLLAGLLTLQDDLTGLNVADWAADEWAKYQELSDAGDNAFVE